LENTNIKGLTPFPQKIQRKNHKRKNRHVRRVEKIEKVKESKIHGINKMVREMLNNIEITTRLPADHPSLRVNPSLNPNRLNQIVTKRCKMKRRGIRVIVRHGVSSDVRIAVHKFIGWIRKRNEFPVRFPIYIKSAKVLTTKDGEETGAIFFEAFDRKKEPYLSVAVGDYEDWLDKLGNKNDALCTILNSVAYGIACYERWIEGTNLTEAYTKKRKKEIMEEYKDAVDSPI
jgi:hypothetical protein